MKAPWIFNHEIDLKAINTIVNFLAAAIVKEHYG
jgi:hypothetical protein